MIKKTNWLLGVTFLFINSSISAAVIDFDTVDSFTSTGRIDSISGLTFSSDLYSFPDGFQSYSDSGDNVAYNYYGESGEYFTFDSAVTLNSFDFNGIFISLPVAGEHQISLLDSSDNILNTFNVASAGSQTLIFNQSNVSKVKFDFTGGDLGFYGDDRYHAWYTVDDISYDVSQVPEPSILALLGAGVVGIGFIRRRKFLGQVNLKHSKNC